MNEIAVWFLVLFQGVNPTNLSMHRNVEACTASLVQYAQMVGEKKFRCIQSDIVVPITTEIVVPPETVGASKVAGRVDENKFIWDIKNPSDERLKACKEGCYLVTRDEFLNSLRAANRVGRLSEKKTP